MGDAQEEGWQEEEVVAATMRVEVAGNLTRGDEKKEEEETGMRWGAVKTKAASESITFQGKVAREALFPTLQGGNKSTNINIDDGSDAKVNIQTSKNKFADLEHS